MKRRVKPTEGGASPLISESELAEQWHMSTRHIARLRGQGMPWVDAGVGDVPMPRYDEQACHDWLYDRKAASDA